MVVSAGDASEIVPLEDLERRYITSVLKIVRDNKSKAAQLLGLDRRTLYRRLEKYASTEASPKGEQLTTK